MGQERAQRFCIRVSDAGIGQQRSSKICSLRTLLAEIESSLQFIDNMVSPTSLKFTAEEMLLRSCLRIASSMHSMWEETGSSDTRLLIEPLISDKLITVGQSRKGADHREHVVPRVFICHECHKLFSANCSINEVAQFIAKHLRVVKISREEQIHLDHNLKLRETMPIDWTVGDDVYARLREANVEFDFYEHALKLI